jgi:hypothetical protein
MDKNKLSHLILGHLYRKECIGFCDIKEFLQGTDKTELEIKTAIASIRDYKWVETNGDWSFLGGKREGVSIILENAHLNARITEDGIKYYKEYLENKRKYKFWIPLSISILALVFTGINTFNSCSTSSKTREIESKQANTEKNIQELYILLDTLKH